MAKKPGTALIKWDQELAEAAKASAARVKLPAGKFISIKDGQLSFAGADIPDNEMNVVVLGWIYENQFYNQAYKDGEFQIPCCFAFSDEEEGMEPHEKSTDPQHAQCEGCPNNEWGSADTGEGKACRNVRRLAVIAESDLEDVENAEIAYLKLPVTSTKNWAAYLKKTLDKVVGRPEWAVVTTITLDGKVVNFKFVDKIDNELMQGVMEKHKKVMEDLAFPYEPLAEGSQKSSKKKPVKKASKFARQ